MMNMHTSEREIQELIDKHGENLSMIASELAARQYDDEDEEGNTRPAGIFGGRTGGFGGGFSGGGGSFGAGGGNVFGGGGSYNFK